MNVVTGQQMRFCRLAAGLTQADLGGLAGVSRTTVNNYELRAKLPRGVAASRLLEVLMAQPNISATEEGIHVFLPFNG